MFVLWVVAALIFIYGQFFYNEVPRWKWLILYPTNVSEMVLNEPSEKTQIELSNAS